MRIWSYSGQHFPAFEYGETRSFSPYSVQMRESADQNNSEYGNFSRSVILYKYSNAKRNWTELICFFNFIYTLLSYFIILFHLISMVFGISMVCSKSCIVLEITEAKQSIDSKCLKKCFSSEKNSWFFSKIFLVRRSAFWSAFGNFSLKKLLARPYHFINKKKRIYPNPKSSNVADLNYLSYYFTLRELQFFRW